MAEPLNHSGPLDFSQILYWLKQGRKAWRKGWNGKNMWLVLIKQSQPTLIPGMTEAIRIQSYIAMYTVQGTLVPWLCSQTDMLAEDWEVIDERYFDTDRRNAGEPSFQ